MNYEKYIRDAAEFRSHMEKPMAPADLGSVTATKEKTYLPGGYERSVRVRLPVPDVDLSALNGKGWKTAKKNGEIGGKRSMGRPRKVKR